MAKIQVQEPRNLQLILLTYDLVLVASDTEQFLHGTENALFLTIFQKH